MRRRLLPCLLLAFGVAASATTPRVLPLNAAGVPALVKPPPHGERIIMFWALDCAFCEPNMQALAKLQRAHPHQIQLVTVDTDDVTTMSGQIAARLDAAGMQDYPALAYAAAAPEQLNFLIDPNWGGETPRTLVIRANGTRTDISGELTPVQLQRVTSR